MRCDKEREHERDGREDFRRRGPYGYDREKYYDRYSDDCAAAYMRGFDEEHRADDRRREERAELERQHRNYMRRQEEARAEQEYWEQTYDQPQYEEQPPEEPAPPEVQE